LRINIWFLAIYWSVSASLPLPFYVHLLTLDAGTSTAAHAVFCVAGQAGSWLSFMGVVHQEKVTGEIAILLGRAVAH